MPYSEDDTRVKIIDPKIHGDGWKEEQILRQHPIADDRFFVEGEDFRRLPTAKYADYILQYNNVSIAVLEAKAEDEDPLKHLSQAQDYAKRLDVPFAYISNGKTIYLHDRRTLKTEEVSNYLSPEEMYEAYKEWRGLSDQKLDALTYPLYVTGTRRPRAYQETAIKNIVENIVKGKKTTLLTMATGTGKTFVAFQTIWKLVKSKRIHRVLFLCDRIILRDDAYSRDFEPFGEARCKIEGGEFNANRDMYFATYQTLFTNDLYKQIPADFFDLIVIDECHRSRYGDWGVVLEHFQSAQHLGMTATPKREDNIDVYEYFGEPVFEYSLGQAIEDGYLVPFKIFKVTTNLYREGLNVASAEEVIYDDEIEPEEIKDFYEPSEYERAITIPEQIDLLSKKVIEILDKTNQYGKTIIFCVDMAHAQAVKDKLNELKSSEEYASRVVSEDKDDLTRFRDKERVMPVVATTVDLLSTGVDIPHLENIIFMRPIASRVLFKQIIGRGSRLFEGKGFFRIIDFTNATRLIDEWDIPTEKPEPPELPEEPIAPYDKLVMGIVVDNKMESPITGAIVKAKLGRWEKLGKTDENGVFKLFGLPSNDKISISIEHAEYKKLNKKLKPHTTENETPYEFRLKAWKSAPKKITIKGIVVTIDEEVEVEFDGIKLSYAEYRKYSKDKISQTIHSSDELRVIWLDPEKRERFIADLEAMKVNITLIKSIENLEDIDSFDVVAHIAFDAPLMTREDRVKHFMRHNAKDIDRYGKEIGEAIREIMEKYKNSGEENLSAQAFLLPNMNAKKEAIQAKYPEGLYGFIHTLKQKVYSFAG
ncbi:MAG: Type I site-specific deoxyribonuclease [Candidatus Daviesbacteria bacterium GW2011_GWB1_41_5]|uniref:Type I site-specific deoxyribonuclease n=1 Tax=Candidatus Daviesbacteria bacterium GW2011_GWB1_41_5 TaxID=1618429 RepID=A0A0G0WNU3_9BACT|nr:MAG: Type I site-specific deoxyribonuclease [Candidatus Daviesbacteria bacterium GW2011_GWB1_41_5]